MIHKKNRLTLKQSLLLLALIPFISFLFTLALQIHSNTNDLKIISNQRLNEDFILINASLISNLQQERGLTATLINGGNTQSQINAMRKNVDELYINTTNKFDNVSFYDKGRDSFISVEKTLLLIRKDVDSNRLDFESVMEKYSDLIKTLTNLNVLASNSVTIGGVGKHLSSITTLIDAQESAGRFRGYASSIITANKPISNEVLNKVILDFNVISININNKGVILSDEAATLREKLLKSQELARSYKAYYTISKFYEEGNYNIISTQIWDDSTKLISYISEMVSDGLNTVVEIDNKLEKDILRDLYTSVIISIITVLLILLVSIIVIRHITRRLSQVTDKLHKMSEGGGDLTTTIDVDISDEIGQLSSEFNSYTGSLSELISNIKRLTVNFVTFGSELKVTISNVNSSKTVVSSSLCEVESDIQKETESISRMGKEMGNVNISTETLSAAVQEQTAAVEQSSAAVEQMIANIRNVTKNVERTANIVSNLSQSGIEGKDQLNSVTKQIANVFELSNTLKNANSLIADIADRTSLLSMNAAIEAAHAGEAGKGFAVVADEIRKLSESTTSQSKGITENLDSIISAISVAVDNSHKTESTFDKIVNEIESVSQNQNQIKSAMMEQNQGSNEILEAISSLKDNSYSVDKAVSDLSIAGISLHKEGNEVINLIKNVNVSVKNMNNAVTEIEQHLNILTNEEEKNSKLVSELSNNMNKFTINE